MEDLERVLWEAWQKVAPMLQANPAELKARLARRRSKMFLRPPRAACLAVRASDHRIEPVRGAALVPEDAMDPTSEWHPGRVIEHQVHFDKRSLVRLCAPVDAHPDGIPAHILAEKLGCSPRDLRTLRRRKDVRVDSVKGFAGRWGSHGVPFLYFDRSLDPAMFAKRAPDPIWGCLWRTYAQMLPDDFHYPLTRRPLYVPAPSSPLATGNSQLATHYEFRGWRWLCPGCKNNASILFYPIPLDDWARYVGFNIGRDALDARPTPNPCFACWRCHGLIYFSPQQLTKTWNHFILHFSGGLLFGREVPRPAWLQQHRLRAFHKPRPRSSPRRDELARLLAHTTLTPAQIAHEMNISPKAMRIRIWLVYKHHNVNSRPELRAKLAPPINLAAG